VRTEGDRWGPRVIDLDLLVWGREQRADGGLDLPHSGISERNFVLLPLCNIAPTLEVPGQGIVQMLAMRVDGTALVCLDEHEQKQQSAGI
jgi:2-amino-4-hydroxy-6-hydroxymethyldihydropteridine diphosphokinase